MKNQLFGYNINNLTLGDYYLATLDVKIKLPKKSNV